MMAGVARAEAVRASTLRRSNFPLALRGLRPHDDGRHRLEDGADRVNRRTLATPPTREEANRKLNRGRQEARLSCAPGGRFGFGLRPPFREWQGRRGAEFLEQARHIFAETAMLDLEFVPRRSLVGNAVADIGTGGRFQFAEPARAFGICRARRDEARDQLRLVVGELPDAAFRRLEQTGDEQTVELAMESVDKKLRASLLIENIALIHEREARLEARGVDDEVDLLFAAADKAHLSFRLSARCRA